MLSDSESDTEDAHQISINEHYAKAFQYRKEREELEKLKLKYGSDYELDGDDDDESDSESDESEDEDGEELTPAVDAAILRTLARIKQKDPEIYNSGKNIFGEERSRISTSNPKTKTKPKESKPVTLRQVVLESTLHPNSRSPSPTPDLTPNQEQQQLRNETLAAFHAGDEDDDDDLLVPREKTKDEMELEEEEYRAFLEREVGKDLKSLISVESTDVLVEPTESTSSPVKEGKKKKKAPTNKKSKEEENQEFLMNYIYNRGWIDKSSRHIPTYNEVTSNRKGKGKVKAEDDEDAGSSNEKDQLPTVYSDVDEDDFEDTVDRFEVSYNYRFEEPDALEIKSYPRDLPSLVRREDTTRKDARERKKERKAARLQEKKEEVKRLKALKMKEIRAKLEKIGHEGGKNLTDDPALLELDLEADWDPDAHDAQMTGLYGDDDYNEEEKPIWDDDIDLGDIMVEEEPTTKKKKKKKKKKGGDEPQVEDGVDIDAMNAEIEHDDEEWDGTEEMRKRKLDQYMNELYELDFNDMVGGMPTKFRYVPVQEQSFALSPAEILMATDAELNEYMGVKKYAPYRKDAHNWDPNRNQKLKDLKSKITERMGTDEAAVAAVLEKPAKKRKGKKERQRAKETAGEDGDDVEQSSKAILPSEKRKREDDHMEAVGGEETKKKKRRHKK